MKLSRWQRLSGHFTTITSHKLKVTGLCFKLGLYKQGILHDLSKYSWVEFSSGVKYYQGHRSPIDAEKENLGYSLGWLHHKGRNKHHWDYWVDKNRDGIFPIKMPYNYLLENVCDRIAACKTYQKDNYSDKSAYEYFINGTDRLYMHPESAIELERLLKIIAENGLDEGFNIIKKEQRTE
ncbi:DUF5662 family protein [Anaerorhabdus sp.]|uniref:Catalase n=1 Tax=bioreactor metagenome TaxID=1076179 RepID=A0A645DXG9_9ZZZZ|nr:DUF5662 family protein [Anaerorhabdus sp.]MEA4874995.1 DUF5662 family protein [Anaerorhabdus sp.]